MEEIKKQYKEIPEKNENYEGPFDKNDICVNARQMISGYKEEELQTVYEWYINNWVKSTTNIKIENGKLYMNENRYVGKNKEKCIINAKDYNAKIIEF